MLTITKTNNYGLREKGLKAVIVFPLLIFHSLGAAHVKERSPRVTLDIKLGRAIRIFNYLTALS